MSSQEKSGPQHIGVDPPGDAVFLEIEGLAAGGRGVARRAGVVWFVPGGLPGDRIRAGTFRQHSRFVEGRLLEIVRPSGHRRQAPCPVQDRCAGCPWMALALPEQHVWKERLIADALARIGGFAGGTVQPIRIAEHSLGYRNRIELTLGPDRAGARAIGMHTVDPRAGLVDVEQCLLQSDAANAVLATARDFLLDVARVPSRHFATADPNRLLLRSSAFTGEVLVAVRETAAPFDIAGELADRLMDRHPEVCGVARVVAHRGRRGGSRTIAVRGRTWIEERAAGLSFRLPASVFMQVHTAMTDLLVDEVVAAAGAVDGAAVLDLYGGVGVHGIALARRGARVTVCDAAREAVRCGQEAVRRHEIGDVRFVHADAAGFFAGHRRPPAFDVVVANPPRTGLGDGVPEAIAASRPRRLILVSCDPATLARDVKRLAQLGYALERVAPFDLFPQTAHVEAVATFKTSGVRS